MLSVVEGIKAAAERNAFAPAMVTAARLVTFGELLQVVARVSNYLADRGIKPGTKVFLNIGDPDFRLSVMVACMHAGLVPFAFQDLAAAGADSDHDLVLGAEVLHGADPKPDLVIDQSVLTGRLVDGKLREFPDRGDDDLLFVTSTTGTTGSPKLVADTAGAYGQRGGASLATPALPAGMLAAGDRVIFTLGDLSRYGVGLSLQALKVGAVLVRHLRDPAETLKVVNILGVTRLLTTPDTMGALMDRMDELPARCPSLRWIGLTGSLFHRSLVERLERMFPDAVLTVRYGTAEVGRLTAGTVTAASFEVGYVGELQPEVRLIGSGTRENPQPITILNSPQRQSLRYVRGKLIPSGEATYTLPDLGYVRDGSLYLLGRDDEVFNADGNKTAFSIIENDLRGLPGIRDVGIVPGNLIGDPVGLLVGVCGAATLDPEMVADRVALIARAVSGRRHIRVVALEAIPRNPGGKVDRNALASAWRAAPGGSPTEQP